MDLKVGPARRLDALDREAAEIVSQSQFFQLVISTIREDLERCRNDCATQEDVIAVRRAQGAVAALSRVLRLPQQLLDQMDMGPAKNGRK